jgi:DNA-binding SARP family transcriptional activator
MPEPHDQLQLCLLGRFELRTGGRLLLDRTWRRTKSKALLKLLALQPGRALHREQVMEALWPHLEPAAAANQLYKSLHYLRAELARQGVRSPVAAGEELVELAGATAVDVDEFRGRARAAQEQPDPARYEHALRAYTGDLLPEDAFEEWAQGPREELHSLRLGLLLELGRQYRAAGQPDRAVEVLRSLLRADPLSEEAHRLLIRLFVQTGERQQALRQYQQCREALRRELGVEPSPETEALHREIVEGGLAQTPAPGAERALLLEELGDVMRRAGDVTRSGPLYEEAAALLEAAGDAAGAMRVHGKAVLGHILGGEVGAAARLLETTEAAIGAQWSDYLTARTYYLLAQLRWHNGRYVEALDAAERALAAARASGDPRERSQAYEVLALACHALGDWQRGIAYELERQQLAVEDGFEVDEALETHLCLWEYHLYGDRPYPEVEASIRTVLQRAESVGNVRAMALCQHALGSVHFLIGRWSESLDELARSVRLARSVGAGQGEVIGSQRLGLLETAMGRLDDGYERLRRAVAVARASQSLQVQAHSFTRTLASLAQNRLQAGELGQAAAAVDESFAIQREVGECITCDGLLYPVAVLVGLATGDLRRAEEACARAEELAASFRSRARGAGARHVRGLVAAKRGDLALARASLQAALDTYTALGQPYEAARSMQALAAVGRRSGNHGEAVADDLEQRAQELYRGVGAEPDPDRLTVTLA